MQTQYSVERKRTHDKCMTLCNIEAPLAKIVVHLHREYGEVLVDVQVDRVSGVEPCVVVDYVALRLGESDKAAEHLGRERHREEWRT